MPNFSKDTKSNRLLQSRRYTIAEFDGQEAFSKVFDLNSSEIYINQGLIPTSSLPYSGSSQNRLYVTASGGGKNILQYYYRLPLTPGDAAEGGKYQTWFALDPSGSVVDLQIITGSQLVNFISNKYAASTLAPNGAEGSPAGYNIVLSKGAASSSAIPENANNYQFDYKTGIIQYVSLAVSPATTEKLWLTAYRYVGDTLDTFISSGSGGGGTGAGFPFSGSAVITGSLLVSGSGATGITVLTVNGGVSASNGFTGSLVGNVQGGINISGAEVDQDWYIPFVQNVGIDQALYADSSDNSLIYNAKQNRLKLGALTGGRPTGSISLTGSMNVLSGSITLNSGSFIGTASQAVNASNAELVSISPIQIGLYPLVTVGYSSAGNVKSDSNPLYVDNAGFPNLPRLGYESSAKTLRLSGSMEITGSLRILSGSITLNSGSLIGTASWATNAITASAILSTDISTDSNYKLLFKTGGVETVHTDSGIVYNPSTNRLTINGDVSASNGFIGSLLGTSSWATNAISASFATSASTALNISPTLFTIPQPNVGDIITGSGIVISASSLPANTYNAIKIGNTELYDNFSSPGRFVINVPNSLSILSGSVSTGSIALLSQNSFDFYERWDVSNAEKNFSSDKDNFTVYKSQSNNDVATTAFNVNRQNGLLYASGGASISGSANIQNNLAVGGTLSTAGASTLNSLTVTNTTTLNGDLVVIGTASFLGSASFINVDNLLVEDKFILLNSGALGAAGVANEGGIIVQTTSSAGVAAGTALFYEQTTNRWMVARSSSVNFNATSITVGATTDYIVTVSASAGAPAIGSSPSNFGLGNNDLSVGQMYIDTSADDIYIYA
jgi:hypothetical protein